MAPPDPVPRVALMTAPDLEVARRLARSFVDEHLVACVNLVPAITSIYRWQGAVEEAQEVLMIAKTASNRIAELEAALRARHPYSCPEFVVLDPEHVGADYLAWIESSTR